jgi:hypothetical protein
MNAFDAGSTDDQAARLLDLADQMREANQPAVEQPHQDDGQTLGM